jgi:hypothetical protein
LGYGLLIYVLVSISTLPIKTLFKPFVGLASLQSLLAGIQFVLQHSVGINIVGESPLALSIQGVAKIVSHGTTYIRGYGTFPHPNLLGAFLFTAIIISLALLLTTEGKKSRLWYSTFLIINIFGLIITFSRAAILATGIAGLFFFTALLFKRWEPKKVLTTLIITFLTTVSAALIFYPLLLTRATISDQAVKERGFYNHIAWNIIKQRPYGALGAGESMLHMEQYSPLPLQPWEKQPIHNYYLLTWVELGLGCALVLIGFFFWHLLVLGKTSFKKGGQANNFIFCLALFCILLGYLFLMFFDHYFYTLNQTQLLLWLVLGLVARETKNSVEQRSNEQIHYL